MRSKRRSCLWFRNSISSISVAPCSPTRERAFATETLADRTGLLPALQPSTPLARDCGSEQSLTGWRPASEDRISSWTVVEHSRGRTRLCVWRRVDAVLAPAVDRRISLNQHPRTQLVDVHCSSCGASFTTRSAASDALVVDVCSNCHPAYTGHERTLSSGSRTERFNRRRALAVR